MLLRQFSEALLATVADSMHKECEFAISVTL